MSALSPGQSQPNPVTRHDGVTKEAEIEEEA